MKLLLDFLPIVLFFIAFKWAGASPDEAASLLQPVLNSIGIMELKTTQIPILVATVVAILATFVQLVLQKALRKPIEKMQWIGLLVIVVFGGMTLVFQDETFIKWKPTVLYWCMAIGFVIAGLFGKNPIELMMKGQMQAERSVWNTLLYSWVVFFGFMGAANLFVAYTMSTDIWVDFKLFGTLGATVIFIVAQGFYMSKHMVSVQTDS